MNRMSQTFMLVAVMSGLVSLTACVGGGGDGGGATPLAPRPTISAAEITGAMPQQGYLAEDYSNAGDSGGLETTLKSDGLTVDVDGQTLTIIHGNSIDIVADYGGPNERTLREFHLADLPAYGEAGPELVVGIGDMTDETAAFLGEPLRGTSYDHADFSDEGDEAPTYFTGTALGGTEFLALNNGLVDLQFASFGAWGVKTGYAGTFEWNGQSKTFSGDDTYTDITFVPVSGGNSAHAAIPDKDASFTGKAIAMATQYIMLENPIQEFFRGDATLTINSAGTGGNLAMSFPNFYNIGFTFNISGTEFHNDGALPSVTDNGNTSPFHFPDTIEGASLSGNFYGDGSAGEASGRFEISGMNPTTGDPTGDQFLFDGSFGVKK